MFENVLRLGLEMKVLVFSEVMWPLGSGGELATYLWVKLLSSVLQISVATAEISEEVKYEMQGLGVDIIKLNFLNVNSRSRLWSSLVRSREYVKKLLADYDIIWVPRLCYPVIQLAKEINKKVVVHLHDYTSIDPSGAIISTQYDYSMLRLLGLKGYLRRLLSRPIWRKIISYLEHADTIIFVSRRQQNIICSRKPSICRAYRVIPNPLPRLPISSSITSSELFEQIQGILEKREYVLFGGGLSKLKGLDIVERLAKLLAKRGIITVISKSSKFVFNKNSGKVYIPRISYHEYIMLLKHAKAFLYPSIYEEPLPYAVIEAVLINIPSLVTSVGGIPEILGEEYPLYIRGKSWSTLNTVVEKLLRRYDEVLEYIKCQANNLKNRWSDEKLKNTFISILREVAEES